MLPGQDHSDYINASYADVMRQHMTATMFRIALHIVDPEVVLGGGRAEKEVKWKSMYPLTSASCTHFKPHKSLQQKVLLDTLQSGTVETNSHAVLKLDSPLMHCSRGT